MSTVDARNQAQLLQTYTDALTGGRYANASAERVGTELAAFGSEQNLNIAGICNVAETQSSATIDSFLSDGEGSVATGDDDVVGSKLGEWHAKLAGGFALELEASGFTVTDVELGQSTDMFYAEINGHEVTVTLRHDAGNAPILEDMTRLAVLLNDEALGGVSSCAYVPGIEPRTFDFQLEAGNIHLSTVEGINAEYFAQANAVMTAINRDDSINWLMGSVNIDENGALYVRSYVGDDTYDVYMDPASYSVEDIKTSFEEGFLAASGYPVSEAEARLDSTDPVATDTTTTTVAPLSTLGNSKATQEEKLAALAALPGLWATADASTKSQFMKTIFDVALNASGGTPDGRALNEAGIAALGGLTGSERAASVLSQIAINANAEPTKYNAAYSALAQTALQKLKDASPENARIAALLDETNTKLA